MRISCALATNSYFSRNINTMLKFFTAFKGFSATPAVIITIFCTSRLAFTLTIYPQSTILTSDALDSCTKATTLSELAICFAYITNLSSTLCTGNTNVWQIACITSCNTAAYNTGTFYCLCISNITCRASPTNATITTVPYTRIAALYCI